MFRVALGLGLALSTATASARADPADYMPTSLVAETLSPRPGSTVLVGFRMLPKPGWRGYWLNPGDSGIAPSVRWDAPAGIRFGPLLHPPPSLITADGIASYVHEGPHLLIARMSVGRSLSEGTRLPLRADLSWAACTATQCVPLRATFSLEMVVGKGEPGPQAGLLRSAVRKLPGESAPSTYSPADGRLSLHVPARLGLGSGVRFFPESHSDFPTSQARSSRNDDGSLVLIAPAPRPAPSGPITGVLSDGRSAYRIRFRPGPAPAAEAPALPPAAESSDPQPAVASSGPGPQVRPQSAAADAADRRSGPPLLALAGLAGLALAGIAIIAWRRRDRARSAAEDMVD